MTETQPNTANSDEKTELDKNEKDSKKSPHLKVQDLDGILIDIKDMGNLKGNYLLRVDKNLIRGTPSLTVGSPSVSEFIILNGKEHRIPVFYDHTLRIDEFRSQIGKPIKVHYERDRYALDQTSQVHTRSMTIMTKQSSYSSSLMIKQLQPLFTPDITPDNLTNNTP